MNSINLLALILLLVLDFVAAGMRVALLNTRISRLDMLEEEQGESLSATRELISRRTRLRAAIKFTQALLRAGIIGLLVISLLSFPQNEITAAGLLGVLVLLALALWLGEFTFESIALRTPEEWAVRLTPLGRIWVMLFSPFISLPLLLAKSAEATRNLVTITEEELISLVDASQQAGEIEIEAQEMIHNVFQLDDTLAREIMIPRVDMLSLDVQTPLEEAAAAVFESGFSRVPIYQDSRDNIVGLLYTKDMLKVWLEGGAITSLDVLKREAYFVPETKKVLALLTEMQAKHMHMAIVVDEYGGIAGVVTLEDIVEEIFGEIQDEFDDGEEELYEQISDSEYLFHGRFPLHELNMLLHVHLESEDADTLGGLIYQRMGRVPDVDEQLQENGLLLIVDEINGRRIQKVRVRRIDEASKREGTDNES